MIFKIFFKRKKVKATFAKLKKGIIDRNEVDKLWKQIFTKLENYFTEYSKTHVKLINGEVERKYLINSLKMMLIFLILNSLND